MKTILTVLALTCLMLIRVSAQVTVEVTSDQDQFLPGEKLPLAVRITNRSGQPLHLGVEPNWLSFDVESADGFIVVKNSDVPVAGEFTLGAAEVAIKRVDIEPCFVLTRPGRYHVTATLRIKAWNVELTSPPKSFDIITGAKIWAQDFGVPLPAGVTNTAPDVRRYTLIKANYLRRQLQLYVQVSDPSESHVFNVMSVGKMVSFSEPETQLDRFSNLHILWQSGASFFTYAVVNPDGDLTTQEIYDYVTTHPRLNLKDDGSVTVVGGVRRIHPEEMPMVKSPDQLPPLAKP
jgi:hypothetical protein